ncbi:MAG: hypothetical protein C5B50_10560, partial [Verrucomicrobia bacterium]
PQVIVALIKSNKFINYYVFFTPKFYFCQAKSFLPGQIFYGAHTPCHDPPSFSSGWLRSAGFVPVLRNSVQTAN